MRRRWEIQISNSLTRQNNNFARASRFFVHFFAVNCTSVPVKMPNLTFCKGRKQAITKFILFMNFDMVHSAVASMRPTEALASVKFWRISPIIFILHKRSSDIFNASWYYKEFSNSVNILWKNYHIIDLKGLRTLTQIFFEQILIKTIGEVNGHPDYVACFWLLLFKFHLN